MNCTPVLLRPSNFHCHCGGWLPPIQHCHCSVLQCFRRSFWVKFPIKLSVAFLTEMGPVFLFTFCHTDCRCDLGNSSKAEQTSNGTPTQHVSCLIATSLPAAIWHCTTWYGTAARQLTTGESTHDWRQWSIPHCTLTHGRRRHSRDRAQSCISVGRVWSFGTIIKPRMNVFDCRWQIKSIRHRQQTVCHCCHQMWRCPTHLIFQSHCVTSVHEAYRYRIGIGVS